MNQGWGSRGGRRGPEYLAKQMGQLGQSPQSPAVLGRTAEDIKDNKLFGSQIHCNNEIKMKNAVLI